MYVIVPWRFVNKQLVIVMDKQQDMIKCISRLIDFYQHETCGQVGKACCSCMTPCNDDLLFHSKHKCREESVDWREFVRWLPLPGAPPCQRTGFAAG